MAWCFTIICGTIEIPISAATMFAMVVSWTARQRDLWPKTTGLEQMMHLLREAVHLVQEQEPLRFEVIQFTRVFFARGCPSGASASNGSLPSDSRRSVGLCWQFDASATSSSPARRGD